MQPLVEAQPIADESGGLGEAASSASSFSHSPFSMPLPVSTTQRNMLALVPFLSLCAWFWLPLEQLLSLSMLQEHYSHVVLIPCVTLYFLFLERKAILTSKRWSPIGVGFLAGGAFLHFAAANWLSDQLTVSIAAFILLCWGIFLLGFGVTVFRKNAFALLFLLFMVPLPMAVLEGIIGFLQRSSAEAADGLFSLIGIPVFRQGFIFSLSHFTVHVAEECSGIRSFLSLVITSLVAGHWFLTMGFSRVALTAIVVPLAIVKNAFRIVGLALLANYVDPTYVTNSALHRTAGIPLFAVSVLVLLFVVWLLRRLETRFQPAGAQAAPFGR
jgi:exosortase